jgi:hypothetical protein
MPATETAESLLKRIRDRRRKIKWYIDNIEPTGVRLTNFNIVCGAIATALTATPAIGGKPLMDVLGLTDPESLSWRVVFALAALFSLLSTIAANLYKSHDIASRLSKAQVCDVKLEGLETLLELNQIAIKEAATQYAQYIAEIPFISQRQFLKSSSALEWVKGEINEPKRSQVVERTISCSGWVEGVDPECHLWLAVEANGYIWPKEREFFADDDGSWKVTIYEEGATAAFSLSLFVANKQAHKKIRAWLDKGDATGNYVKMRRVPGTRRIASVDGLRRENVPPPRPLEM